MFVTAVVFADRSVVLLSLVVVSVITFAFSMRPALTYATQLTKQKPEQVPRTTIRMSSQAAIHLGHVCMAATPT